MHNDTNRLATSVAGCSIPTRKREVLKRSKAAVQKSVRRTTQNLLRRILAGEQIVVAKLLEQLVFTDLKVGHVSSHCR